MGTVVIYTVNHKVLLIDVLKLGSNSRCEYIIYFRRTINNIPIIKRVFDKNKNWKCTFRYARAMKQTDTVHVNSAKYTIRNTDTQNANDMEM